MSYYFEYYSDYDGYTHEYNCPDCLDFGYETVEDNCGILCQCSKQIELEDIK